MPAKSVLVPELGRCECPDRTRVPIRKMLLRSAGHRNKSERRTMPHPFRTWISEKASNESLMMKRNVSRGHIFHQGADCLARRSPEPKRRGFYLVFQSSIVLFSEGLVIQQCFHIEVVLAEHSVFAHLRTFTCGPTSFRAIVFCSRPFVRALCLAAASRPSSSV